MFRSRRSALIKRLYRHRIAVARTTTFRNETDSPLEEDEPKSALHAMLKRLKEAQLENLARALEGRGQEEPGPCVLVPAGARRGATTSASGAPQVLTCQLWRWPDLRHPQELKQLSHLCKEGSLSTMEEPSSFLYICCNPYHWSKLCKPDSPPPPYTRHPQEYFITEDRAPSEPVSLETGGTNQYGSIQSHLSECSDSRRIFKPWCNIAYWELSTRVGRLFPVCQPSMNVFGDLPHGEGLCLGVLAQNRDADSSSVLHTRSKIGRGLTLFREGEDEIWMYNRSDYPLFVNSPTLDPPNTKHLTVYKVPPGHCIKIFDYVKSDYNRRMLDPAVRMDGPFDPYSVRISFAKGFGSSRYTRQYVTSCPCWLEIIFTVNR